MSETTCATAAEVGLLLANRFADAVTEGPGPVGDTCLYVTPEKIVDVVRVLRDEQRFDFLMDETCVDYPDREPRFEVIYNLYSLSTGVRVFLKVKADDSEPGVPSITPLYRAANWFEREIYDMFGVRFAGHPDLRRILLYESFKGHALRKDYDATLRQPLIGPADGPDHARRHG